jgi:hypothetical protein
MVNKFVAQILMRVMIMCDSMSSYCKTIIEEKPKPKPLNNN